MHRNSILHSHSEKVVSCIFKIPPPPHMHTYTHTCNACDVSIYNYVIETLTLCQPINLRALHPPKQNLENKHRAKYYCWDNAMLMAIP